MLTIKLCTDVEMDGLGQSVTNVSPILAVTMATVPFHGNVIVWMAGVGYFVMKVRLFANAMDNMNTVKLGIQHAPRVI